MNIRLGEGSIRLRLNGGEAETLLQVNQLTITMSWVTQRAHLHQSRPRNVPISINRDLATRPFASIAAWKRAHPHRSRPRNVPTRVERRAF